MKSRVWFMLLSVLIHGTLIGWFSYKADQRVVLPMGSPKLMIQVDSARVVTHEVSHVESAKEASIQSDDDSKDTAETSTAEPSQSEVSAPSSEELTRWALTNNAPPVYPRVSRARGEQGRVLVAVTISKEGGILDAPTIRESSGFDLLDRAALDAVRGWKFQASVQSTLTIPFIFTLQ